MGCSTTRKTIPQNDVVAFLPPEAWLEDVKIPQCEMKTVADLTRYALDLTNNVKIHNINMKMLREFRVHIAKQNREVIKP